MVTKLRLLIFAGAILAVVILDYILFVGIFSQIPRVMDLLFQSSLLSIVIFFWVFIILPVLIAYILIIRPATKKLDEQIDQWKIVLTAIITLGVATVLFWRLAQPRSIPWALEPINEATEFQTDQAKIPEGVIASKIIAGKHYRLKAVLDAETVNLYTTDEESERIVWTGVPVSPERTTDFWYDQDSSTLFTVEGKGSTVGGNAYEQVTAYTQEGTANVNIKNLWIGKPGLYSGMGILSFYPNDKTLLLKTSGGDGCSGWGKIWKLGYNGSEKTVQEIGAGCTDLKLPRYIGFANGVIVLAEFENKDDFTKSHMIKLYTHNPRTGQKITILAKSEIPPDIFEEAGWSVEQEGDKLFVVVSEEKAYRVDISRRKIVSETDIPFD